MRVGRANSRLLNSYCAITVLQTPPRFMGVAISGSSSWLRMLSLCRSGRSPAGLDALVGKLIGASFAFTRPFDDGICGVCRIVGWPVAVCTRNEWGEIS